MHTLHECAVSACNGYAHTSNKLSQTPSSHPPSHLCTPSACHLCAQGTHTHSETTERRIKLCCLKHGRPCGCGCMRCQHTPWMTCAQQTHQATEHWGTFGHACTSLVWVLRELAAFHAVTTRAASTHESSACAHVISADVRVQGSTRTWPLSAASFLLWHPTQVHTQALASVWSRTLCSVSPVRTPYVFWGCQAGGRRDAGRTG